MSCNSLRRSCTFAAFQKALDGGGNGGKAGDCSGGAAAVVYGDGATGFIDVDPSRSVSAGN